MSSFVEFLKQRAETRTYDFTVVAGRQVWMRSLFANEREEVRRSFVDDSGNDTRPDAGELRQAKHFAISIVEPSEPPVQDPKTGLWSAKSWTLPIDLGQDPNNIYTLQIFTALPTRDVDALTELLNRMSFLSKADIAKNLQVFQAPGPS